MKDLEKVQKSLDIVFDYVNNQHEGECKKDAMNNLELAIKQVENLALCKVSVTLPPEENILNAMRLLAEIDYKNEWVWGYDTDLGKPKDIIEAFKNELLGN